MSLFVNVLLENILPAFVVIGLGFILDRNLHIDKKSLSRLGIYVLTPCLVFSSLIQSQVDPAAFGNIVLYVLATTLAMVGLALGVARLLRWSGRQSDALVLSVAFVNSGNMGLSVILFAYGEIGLEFATVFFVAQNFLTNSLAAFFAGRNNGAGARQALLNVLKLPGPYAFLLAMVVRAAGISLPSLITKPVNLVGGGSVPIMLMLLGMQLSQTQLSRRYGEIGVGVFMRLIVGSAVAVALAPLLGLQGLARNVAIVQASTPTAVTSSLMAVQFDADADYVVGVIFFSTLLSSLTLTALLAILG